MHRLTCILLLLGFLTPAAATVDSPAAVLTEIETRNPRLKAQRAQIRVFGHALGPAGALPDPEFMVGLSNLPLSKDSTPLTGLQFELRQRFPWFGTLGARKRLAGAEQEIQRAELRRLRQALMTKAQVLLWRMTGLAQQAGLERERLALLEQLAHAVEAVYINGQGRGADLLRPQIESHRSHERLLGLAEQEASLRARLNALRDRPSQHPFDLPRLPKAPELDIVLGPKDTALLQARAQAANPGLQKADENLQSRRQALLLARKQKYPNFSLGLQYRLRWVETMDAVAGADFVGLNLGVSLPLWSGRKQQESEHMAAARIEASRHGRESERLELDQAVARSLLRIKRHRDQTRLLTEHTLPDAHRAFDAALSDYQAGLGDLPAVLEQLKLTIQVKTDVLKQRIALLQEKSILEGLVGLSDKERSS